MSVFNTSFKNILTGENAFYNSEDYLLNTKKDFEQEILPPVYSVNIENKVWRIAKDIFSVIIFPIGIYRLIHSLIGKVAVLPSSSPSLYGLEKAENLRAQLVKTLPFQKFKYKRITVEVDGYKIDAVIMGNKETFGNGRWLLASNGNGANYEEVITAGGIKSLLDEINSNAIVFNYPGVGASSGMPSQSAMTKAYKAMLMFLEDQENGIAAKEIIGYGSSIGGGVQGEVLKEHQLKKDIKYVFVKSQTFSNLETVISKTIARPIGVIANLFGWNLDSVESSKKLVAPEIILQTVEKDSLDKEEEPDKFNFSAICPDFKMYKYYYKEINDSSSICNDGVIPAEATLAKALLDDESYAKDNKLFIGIDDRHSANIGVKDNAYLGKAINQMLRK